MFIVMYIFSSTILVSLILLCLHTGTTVLQKPFFLASAPYYPETLKYKKHCLFRNALSYLAKSMLTLPLPLRALSQSMSALLLSVFEIMSRVSQQFCVPTQNVKLGIKYIGGPLCST